MYAAFLFRYFDENGDGALQVSECEAALSYLKGDSPVAIACPAGDAQGVVSKLDFWLMFKAMMGSRSLRFTGEQIYGTGVQTDADDELSEQMRESVRLATIEHDDDDDYSPIILARNPEFFDDVGGLAPWEALCKCFVDDDDDPSHLNL